MLKRRANVTIKKTAKQPNNYLAQNVLIRKLAAYGNSRPLTKNRLTGS
jgi:hypothetical protein